MLYALGPVVFDVVPLNTDKVGREGETNYAEHAVVGAAPLYEFTGEGPRAVTLRGTVFPEHFGGLSAVAALDAMRRAGVPQHLLRGDGTPIGWVLIEKVKEDHEFLDPRGVGRAVGYAVEVKICDAPLGSALIGLVGGLFG